jgi:proteasome lid subunit RPN8/RPN11
VTRVRIRQAVIDAVIAHATRAVPNECCGLLLGSTHVIDESYPARNLLESATRFLIDPADHFDAIRKARASGRAVRGAYHSHPRGPSEPSRTDIAEVADPDLLHMIVSLEDGMADVRVFEWKSGNFVTLDLVPVPDGPALQRP